MLHWFFTECSFDYSPFNRFCPQADVHISLQTGELLSCCGFGPLLTLTSASWPQLCPLNFTSNFWWTAVLNKYFWKLRKHRHFSLCVLHFLQAAQVVLISLFELNTPEFTMLLGALPKTFQDGATKLLHNHLKNSSNTSSNVVSAIKNLLYLIHTKSI